jgi:hypothetical protein
MARQESPPYESVTCAVLVLSSERLSKSAMTQLAAAVKVMTVNQ